MKYLILTFCLVSASLKSQNSDSSKFGFIGEFGFGNAQLSHSNYGKINGNSIMFSDKFLYKISDRFNLSTGIGFVIYNGNVVVNGNSNNLNNKYFQIPLNTTFSSPFYKGISENIRYVIGIGGYANYLFESNLSSALSEIKEDGIGWNFGINANVGLRFKIRPKASLSLLYELNSDLSDIEKNNIRQRINNSMGLKCNVAWYF